MSAPIPMKVGDTVWVFDENRRHYPTDARGRATGGPIWREHWVEHTVVGENRATFFLDKGSGHFEPAHVRRYVRVSKVDLRQGKLPSTLCLSLKELNRRAWVHDNTQLLVESIRRCHDFEKMAGVARLIAPELAPPDDL